MYGFVAKGKGLHRWLRGSLVATSMVALATLLLFKRPAWVSVPIWLPLLAAVLVSAWLVGGVSGWIAVGLSLLSFDFFFTPPLYSFAIGPGEWPVFVSFAVACLVTQFFGTWRRIKESARRRVREELENRVSERTEQWRVANAALKDEIVTRQRAEIERQEARAALAHFSRLTTMGELAASIAHEINQPLAAIVTNGGACSRWLTSQPPNLTEVGATLHAMMSDARRASAVIGRIRALVRKGPSVREPMSINSLLEEVAELLAAEFKRYRVVVSFDLAPDLPMVSGDRVQLQQVVLNLLLNATEAIGGSQSPVREIVVRSWQEGDMVLVSVRDSGPGLPETDIARLFTPFFTTKENGLGLGLSISRSIVEAQGGRWTAVDALNPGMLFAFAVPVGPDGVLSPLKARDPSEAAA